MRRGQHALRVHALAFNYMGIGAQACIMFQLRLSSHGRLVWLVSLSTAWLAYSVAARSASLLTVRLACLVMVLFARLLTVPLGG